MRCAQWAQQQVEVAHFRLPSQPLKSDPLAATPRA